MKILYTPLIVNGEQAQGDEIIKYDIYFSKNKPTDVSNCDNKTIAKLLTCPYFSDVNDAIELTKATKTVKKAAKKK